MKNHTALAHTNTAFTLIAMEGNLDSDPFEMGGDILDNYDYYYDYDVEYGELDPKHKVQFSDFWLCEYLVTQAVWAYIMQNTDWEDPSHFEGQNRPVEQVSWNDIKNEFLPKLNKMTEGERPHGTEYRLPTEAEWEYAARGGKYWKEFPFEFSGSNDLDKVGWYRENSRGETKPVGLKAPNCLGLYDMSGNVKEWCEDYDLSFYEKCDEQGVVMNPFNRKGGNTRAIRGGSWNIRGVYCRPTFRGSHLPSFRDDFLGFRLALVFLPKKCQNTEGV